jgi:hypothetical protein
VRERKGECKQNHVRTIISKIIIKFHSLALNWRSLSLSLSSINPHTHKHEEEREIYLLSKSKTQSIRLLVYRLPLTYKVRYFSSVKISRTCEYITSYHLSDWLSLSLIIIIIIVWKASCVLTHSLTREIINISLNSIIIKFK